MVVTLLACLCYRLLQCSYDTGKVHPENMEHRNQQESRRDCELSLQSVGGLVSRKCEGLLLADYHAGGEVSY